MLAVMHVNRGVSRRFGAFGLLCQLTEEWADALGHVLCELSRHARIQVSLVGARAHDSKILNY